MVDHTVHREPWSYVRRKLLNRHDRVDERDRDDWVRALAVRVGCETEDVRAYLVGTADADSAVGAKLTYMAANELVETPRRQSTGPRITSGLMFFMRVVVALFPQRVIAVIHT